MLLLLLLQQQHLWKHVAPLQLSLTMGSDDNDARLQ